MGVFDWVNEIEDPDWRKGLLELHEEYREQIETFPAAISWHHAYTGGYSVHICQVVEIALANYVRLSQAQQDAIGDRDDVILVSLMHDFRKLISYERENRHPSSIILAIDGKEAPLAWVWADPIEMSDSAFVVRELARHGIILEDELIHALDLAHGGWSPIASSVHKRAKNISPLAALLHAADMISSQCMGAKPEEWSDADHQGDVGRDYTSSVLPVYPIGRSSGVHRQDGE